MDPPPDPPKIKPSPTQSFVPTSQGLDPEDEKPITRGLECMEGSG
jgi:hypothetical protein